MRPEDTEMASGTPPPEFDDGGLAFPLQASEYGNHGSEPGMTLRDYFAAQAMIALHCSEERGGQWNEGSSAICARNCYKLADAMLAARQKGDG